MSLRNVDCLIKSCTGAHSRSNVIEELMRRELDEEYLNKGITSHTFLPSKRERVGRVFVLSFVQQHQANG